VVTPPLSTLATAGGDTVVITGNNLGPIVGYNIPQVYYWEQTSTVLYGPVTCTVTTAHSTMEFQTVPGVGMNLRFQVVVGGLNSTVYTSSVNFNAPNVTSTTAGLLSTLGNEIVTVFGNSFGPTTTPSTLLGLRYGGTTGVLVGTSCQVLSQSSMRYVLQQESVT
jgi:hypothetical protein